MLNPTGGCGCCCGGLWPCSLDTSKPLKLAYDGGEEFGQSNGTLAYQGDCLWSGMYAVNGANPSTFAVKGIGSGKCTYYKVTDNGPEFFGYNLLDHPVGCSGMTIGGPLEILSFTCTPLNIVLANPLDPGGITWTLTQP